MTSGFSAYGDLDSEEDLIQDYEETQAASKKDWFKPASASLARLDRVKPVATVYNLGLRDPRDLQAGRGKVAPVPVPAITSQLSVLQTEPPLSTVSYQKAAWGSQTSIPELLKQAAQAGIRPGRPSSAKTSAISKPPKSRKVRPQSAKDPLCPQGKKKNASTFGVKGHRFDPSERMCGRPGVPSSGGNLGWAGPPAGLCDPTSPDGTIDSEPCVLQKSQAPIPPAPHTSPEPEDEDNIQSCSPTPTPVCLNLSLPSADMDVDASDDMDTERLMEKADQYIEKQKKKEFQKMRYFRADLHSPHNTGESADMPATIWTQQRLLHVAETLGDEERAETAGCYSRVETKPVDSGFEDPAHRPKMQMNCSQENTNANASCISAIERLTADACLELETDSEDGDMKTKSEKPLPPSSGFDLEYLGPARKEKKNRSHPIFLMPEKKKTLLYKETRLSSGRPKTSNEKQESSNNYVKDQAGAEEMKKEAATVKSSQQKGSCTLPTTLRSGVQIREDYNITVDITPRNMGRKVTKTPSRKNLAGRGDLADQETKTDLQGQSGQQEGKGRRLAEEIEPQLEITGNRNRTINSIGAYTTSATTVSVMYDDDDNNDHKKKSWRHCGPMKEKDVVTMVSDLSLSAEDDDDGDDPSREVDIHLKGNTEAGHQSSADKGRSVSTQSTGERNYYDIARKQTKDCTTSGSEEKENIITVTTKTILFDLENPKESIVKKILDAPLGKPPREGSGCASPEKLLSRPRSATHPKSAKMSKSDLHSVIPNLNSPCHDDDNTDDDDDNFSGDGGFTASAKFSKCGRSTSPTDEERPESRMGFVSMETDARSDEEEADFGIKGNRQADRISQRPPSGRRRPRSAASKALTRPSTAGPGKPHHKTAKDSVCNKNRPQSASSAVSQSPSPAEIHRANAAAQALRSQREAVVKPPSTGPALRLPQSQRHYATYHTRTGRQTRAQSASVCHRPAQIISNDPDLEVEDPEQMEECREIQNRLACYGIDIKPQTLQRALCPPSGKTLYYQVDAQLPASYSSGLLSHPRYWLPEEHRKLRIAEKKLAMAELALWRQKKEEERKARQAASIETGGKKGKKKKKKKGKKKLIHNQSIC